MDASIDVDGSSDIDAGQRLDGGTFADSAPVVDAADALDAAVGMDSALAPDARAPVDAYVPDSAARNDAGPNVGGETCAVAFDVTSGGTFSGTLVGARDDYDSRGIGCNFGGVGAGAELAYSVTPSAETSYRITIAPERFPDGGVAFEPQIWTATDCDQTACPDGQRLLGGATVSHTFSAAAGVTTFVVVEADIFGDSGAYTMTVEIL